MRSLRFAVITGLAPLALLAVAFGTSGCGSGVARSVATPKANSSGAQLGYFWNASDQTLRPVLGIAGASQVGASVVNAGEYVLGAGSAASGMGLLEHSDGSLEAMQLPSGDPVHLGVSSSGSVMRFSPTGTAAVIFSPGSLSVTIVTGLTSTPKAAVLPAPASVADAVTSDSGNVVMAVTAPSGGVRLINGATGASLATPGQYGGMSFASADNLLYADAATNAALLVQNESTTATVRELASSALLKSPGAVGVSASGQWAVIQNSTEPSLVRLDLTAQNAPLRIACSCTPTSVVPLAGSSFRVTEPGSGPLWAVDAAPSAARSFFIPALPAATQGAH